MHPTLLAFGADRLWTQLLLFPAAALGCWVAFTYLVVPLVIRAKQTFPRVTQVVPFDDALGLPAEVEDYLDDSRSQFASLGYVSLGRLALPDPVEHVRSFAEMFVDRNSKDVALVSFIYGVFDGKVLQRVRLVDVGTWLRGGDVVLVNTSNGDEPHPFTPQPDERHCGLPLLKNLAQLVEAHRRLVALHGGGARPYSRLDEEFKGDGAALFAAVISEGYAKAERQGLFRFDALADCWRPTLFGAYKLCWQNLWPFSALRRARRLRNCRRLLRELAIEPAPAETNLNEGRLK